MHIPTSDFSHLMREVAEGNPNAFAELFHHYNTILLAQLRSSLKRIRCLDSLLDPEELAQDIWTDFAVSSLRLRHFPTPDHLLRHMVRTARCHLLRGARNHLRIQKNNVRRRHHLSTV